MENLWNGFKMMCKGILPALAFVGMAIVLFIVPKYRGYMAVLAFVGAVVIGGIGVALLYFYGRGKSSEKSVEEEAYPEDFAAVEENEEIIEENAETEENDEYAVEDIVEQFRG